MHLLSLFLVGGGQASGMVQESVLLFKFEGLDSDD